MEAFLDRLERLPGFSGSQGKLRRFGQVLDVLRGSFGQEIREGPAKPVREEPQLRQRTVGQIALDEADEALRCQALGEHSLGHPPLGPGLL